MQVILTHDHADFDAVAALLAAHKLYPTATPILPVTLNRNVAEFMALYGKGFPFVRWYDFKGTHIERVILVDTQQKPALAHVDDHVPLTIIDHHPRRNDLPPDVSFSGERIGSTTTLLIEQIRDQAIGINSLEATLLALGIYEDTGSLTYKITTARDILAAAWVVEHDASLDAVRRFLSPPLDDTQRDLFEKLMHHLDTRTIQGCDVTIAATNVDSNVDQINSVARRIREIIEPDVLFVVVEMPHSIQIVARSNRDALDVGAIMREYGGGGHTRAAAANIENMQRNEIVSRLWQFVQNRIEPVTRVSDLMSQGVQLVSAKRTLREVIQQLRRIGHEGYPVTETGQPDSPIIGLLTRRDADRAWEHGLKDSMIRDIMQGGATSVSPDDAVGTLEHIMVETGWGQIPVVDTQGLPVGIVTRTDLIKHWAKTHPASAAPPPRLGSNQIETVLGSQIARLVDLIAQNAQQSNINMYLVGGVVRDLLLERPNFDIDFVIESDAIHFANRLKETIGGEVSAYQPFRTAKWRLDEDVAAVLEVAPESLPDHIDFATARYEFYEHPTALPTVYTSSIKLDLHRRDFTINTLAAQLSPAPVAGRLLDFYGGLADLENKRIRVLHSLSFIDDPTRILRAVRFEHRLKFTIEPRTSELISYAHPMLRRITGERLRNELNLLIREEAPEHGLIALQERDILSAIHPDFKIDPDIVGYFPRVRDPETNWPAPVEDHLLLYWHIALSVVPAAVMPELGERLLVNRTNIKSLTDASELRQSPDVLAQPDARPSQIVRKLDECSVTALLTVWLVTDDDNTRECIRRYLQEWRHVRTAVDGNTLREMGLPPGPEYRVILERLLAARLDGEIVDDRSEYDLAKTLVRELSANDA